MAAPKKGLKLLQLAPDVRFETLELPLRLRFSVRRDSAPGVHLTSFTGYG